MTTDIENLLAEQSLLVEAQARFLESHEVKGELTVPDDELEIYRMLGEKLPFLWPDEEFLSWAEERTPP